MRGGGGWLRRGRSPQEAGAWGRGVGNVGAAFGSGGSILAKGEGGGSCWRWGKELTGGPALSAKEGEGRDEGGGERRVDFFFLFSNSFSRTFTI